MNTSKTNITDLAFFVLMYSIKNEIPINHLKLQKLLYYVQAWHLVYFNENPLFDEVAEAWVNGPVYKTIYKKIKSKKYDIYEELGLVDEITKNIDREFLKFKKKLNLENEQYEFLDAIFKHYGLMSHEQLIFLTHSEKPWNEARKGLNAFDYSNNKISHESMYEFYKQRLETKK